MTATTKGMRLILICLLANNCQRAMSGFPVIDLIDTHDIFVREGERDVQLSCTVFPGDEYTFVNVTHLHPLTGQERLLGRLNSGLVVELTDGYNLTSSTSQFQETTITLTVTEVRGADDGEVKFEAFPDTSLSAYTQPLTATRNLTVILNATSVDIDLPEVTGCQGTAVQDGPVDVIAGEYEVTCAAEGSNPAITNFSLLLDGQILDLIGDPQIQLTGGGADGRRYTSQVIARASLTRENASHILQCQAFLDWRGLSFSGSKVVSAIDTSATRPVVSVTCDHTRVPSDAKDADLTCRIRHPGKGDPSYSVRIEPSGQRIDEGNAGLSNASWNVTCLSSSTTEVRLTLDSPRAWHFESTFFMIVNITGNVTQERIHLTRVDDDDGGGGCSHSNTTGFFVIFLLLLLSHVLSFLNN